MACLGPAAASVSVLSETARGCPNVAWLLPACDHCSAPCAYSYRSAAGVPRKAVRSTLTKATRPGRQASQQMSREKAGRCKPADKFVRQEMAGRNAPMAEAHTIADGYVAQGTDVRSC